MARTRVHATLEEARLAALCNALGTGAADDHGFVSVARLLSSFRAHLILRPLLVEAMLAKVEEPTGSGRAGWAVLVDSETYPLSQGDIDGESAERPLPDRFRNTVAHELAHSLAFRPTEFGLSLDMDASKFASSEDFVAEVERVTEQISPSLLAPDASLRKLLTGCVEPLTPEDLERLRQKLGVSRYVLINRLATACLPANPSDLRSHPALANLGIVLGEWAANGEADLRKWPLFMNFADGIVPRFLLKLKVHDRVPARDVLPTSNLLICGGMANSEAVDTPTGPPDSRFQRTIKAHISVDTVAYRPGSTFFVTIHNEARPSWSAAPSTDLPRRSPAEILARHRS